MDVLKALFAAALLGSAAAAFAADEAGRGPARDGASVRVESATLDAMIREARTELDAARAPKLSPGAEAAFSTVTPKATTPIANSYRAYPPSCIADPLPIPTGANQIGGRVYARTAKFDAINTNTGQFQTEDVNVYIWRLPCSGGDSVTLLTLRRLSQYEGDARFYPIYPLFRLTQGGNTNKFVRAAQEPNTIITNQEADTPLVFSTTLVLENFPSNSTSTAYWDFNLPFRLTMVYRNGQTEDLSANDPYRPSEYPDAALPLPINGYMSGNWTDPAHSGEGINLEVGEVVGTQTRYLFFAWFTFDELGLPYWISGGGPLSDANAAAPTRQINAPAIYRTGGGFAGDFGSDTNRGTWGNVSFEFIDCNTVRMGWQTVAGLPANTPGRGSSGGGTSGVRSWKRGSTINGLTCDMPPVN